MSDVVERLRWRAENTSTPAATTPMLCAEAADEITALRAENERLKIENIQMQAALGYGILAEDERHILPSNPFKCGTCDASKHLRAENERLRAELHTASDMNAVYEGRLQEKEADNERLRAALKMWDDAVKIDVKMQGPQYAGVRYLEGREAWKATYAALEEKP